MMVATADRRVCQMEILLEIWLVAVLAAVRVLQKEYAMAVLRADELV
jgi:hypothetical protein